ncbi:MAG: NAD-dependent DNA ligase LigA [Christensenellaceae bacterium]|jgi:DNA ligase (NAD+)|nr:NAD-dependent DNA ligase LigA [Christensenellaceae bacterium]
MNFDSTNNNDNDRYGDDLFSLIREPLSSNNYSYSEIVKRQNKFDYEKYVLRSTSFSESDYQNNFKLLKSLESSKKTLNSKSNKSKNSLDLVDPSKYSPSLRDSYFTSKSESKVVYKSFFDKYIPPESTIRTEDVLKFLAGKEIKTPIYIESRTDGFSVVLKYHKHLLISALILSTGKKGLNIKEQMQSIYSVPLIINDESNIEIYGTVTIRKSDYLCAPTNKSEILKTTVENILLKSKDKNNFSKLVFVANEVIYKDNVALQAEEKRAFLDANYFVKESFFESTNDYNSVIDTLNTMPAQISTSDFFIYGASIQFNQINDEINNDIAKKTLLFCFVPSEQLNKMIELSSLISKYDREYYIEDTPSVSDAEYDLLYDELKFLESKFHYVMPNSPTLRIGGLLLSTSNKHQHLKKLYSLNKAQTFEELESFMHKISLKEAQPVEFCIEHKFDGLALSLTYENGDLIKGATRGNGEVGEDVTEQIKTIRTVPFHIDYKGKIEIQGEAIIKLSVFNSLLSKTDDSVNYAFNENEESNNNTQVTTLFKSPRNAAAGAIKNLDTKETAKRKLTFIAYSVGYSDKSFSTQLEIRNFLIENGFYTEGPFEIVDSFEKAKTTINNLEVERDNLDYEIDGIALKINNLNIRDELGYAEKHPEWAIAYKYKPIEKTTFLRNVNWQISRAGRLTPVAIFDPVVLGGVTVEKASLHNITDIEQKGICYNDTVLIHRSNDVIPEIIKVVEHHEDSKKILPPENCPECGSKTKLDGPFLCCTNSHDCSGIILQGLMHFTSKSCMNISNLQERYLKLFYEKLNIKTFDGLFSLTVDAITQLKLDNSSSNISEETAKNIVEAITNAKTINLPNFLFALNIPQVGEVAARDLASKFGSLDQIIKATESEISTIPNFGPVITKNIVNYFADQSNIDVIKKMIELGVLIKSVEKPILDKPSPIHNKIIVVTGTISICTRDQLFAKITNLGGISKNSISKSTSFLVVGENAGANKLKEANRYNIPILSEKEFLNLIEN